MSERDVFERVGLARERLSRLRARLEGSNAAPGSTEVASALRELHDTLETLHARHELVREILDRTNEVVFAKNRAGRYTLMNPSGAELFGKTVAEVVGADDRALFGQVEAERIMASDREVMRTGQPRTYEQASELRGARTTLLTTTTAWYDTERNVRGVIGIAQDLTERRRHERQAEADHDRMRSMAVELVLEEERLRRALAAELHDGLGQDIALAKLKLSTLRSSASAEVHELLRGIEQLVERADRSLRSITYEISPPSLHDLGLVAALEWLAENVGAKHGMEVRVANHASPAVTDERVRLILFRAVRELLVNAALHAGVRTVTIDLAQHGELVRVVVADAGAGFEADDPERGGFGLFGIREQLTHLHGSMHIDSVPGRGTTVTLLAPFAEQLLSSTR